MEAVSCCCSHFFSNSIQPVVDPTQGQPVTKISHFFEVGIELNKIPTFQEEPADEENTKSGEYIFGKNPKLGNFWDLLKGAEFSNQNGRNAGFFVKFEGSPNALLQQNLDPSETISIFENYP